MAAPFALDELAYDLVYDPYRERVYASLNGYEFGVVARINPGTGAIDGELRLEGQVGPLALSPDGSRLWVGFFDQRVAGLYRVDPETMKAGELTPLDPRNPSRPIPTHLVMLPGTKNSVVASLTGISKPTAGVYDAGIARPETVDGPICSGMVYSGEGNTFFAFNNQTTGWDLQELLVTDAGVRLVQRHGNVARGFGAILTAGGGRIFPTAGNVFDVKTRKPVGELPSLGDVGIDEPNRRLYLVSHNPFLGCEVSVLDWASLKPTASYRVPREVRKLESVKFPTPSKRDGPPPVLLFRGVTCKPVLMLGETGLVVNHHSSMTFLPTAAILKGTPKNDDGK